MPAVPPLQEIPAALSPKTGWPWTAEADRVDPAPSGPLISVVIPTYHQGQYLEEAIRSVLLQDYHHWELIIIDGGSTDQTVPIIRRYDPWITHWVSEKDRGQTHAINKGFDRCRGEWVAWLNSDDLYLPGAFRALAGAVEANPQAEVIFGDKESFNADGSFRQDFVASLPSFETMLPWQSFFSESAFYRRSVLVEIRPDESFQHYMDCDFFWRLFLSERKFAHAPAIRARWRIHSECKSIKGKDRADQERFTIMLQVFNDFRTPDSAKPWIMENLLSTCRHTFGSRRLDLFREQFQVLRKTVGAGSLGAALWIRYLFRWVFALHRPQEVPVDLNIQAPAYRQGGKSASTVDPLSP